MTFETSSNLKNKSRNKLPHFPNQSGHLCTFIPLILGTLFLSLTSQGTIGQELLINEFMSDNESTITDQDGHYVDWIELYNASSESINLSGYHLSDDATIPNKWAFPDIEIDSGAFLMVYASGKNLIGPELHTNFKISADGEKLLLTNPAGEVIDQWSAVPLIPDQSYGRIPDGGETILAYDQSTPAGSNGLVNQMLLSKSSGFYSDDFQLTVVSLLGDSVYYTLDGSVPTPSSNLYESPILISDVNSEANVLSEVQTSTDEFWLTPDGNVPKGTIIRLASYKDGVQSSSVISRTYFVNEQGGYQPEMPIVSIIIEQESLFDHDTGIYVQGVNFDPDSPLWTGNYYQKGLEWERDAHVEYFDDTGEMEFAQDAGIRVHGGGTRRLPQKSLRLTARSEYGRKYFYHPMFEGRDCEKYRELLLKTSMASWRAETIINDAYASSVVEEMNLESLHQKPVAVYLNGEYWGIHYLSERISEKYLEYVHEVDEDSVDIIAGNYDLITIGSNSDYVEVLDYLEDKDVSEEDHFQYIKDRIDIDSYIDYQIAEIFLKNYDWPQNNIKLWQPKNSEGRWRWIFYDLDAAFGNPAYNMLVHATTKSGSEPKKSTFLFSELLRNQEFRDQFADRYRELLETELSAESLSDKLDEEISKITADLPEHIERWGSPLSMKEWYQNVESEIASFIEERGCLAEENLIEFLDLSDYRFPCHQSENPFNNGELVVMPNPNRGEFALHNNSGEELLGDLKIYTLQGQMIYEEAGVRMDAGQKLHFHDLNLEAGTYIVNLVGSQVLSAKMIVVNGLSF